MTMGNRKEGGTGSSHHSNLNEHGGGHNVRIQLANGIIQREGPGGGCGGGSG